MKAAGRSKEVLTRALRMRNGASAGDFGCPGRSVRVSTVQPRGTTQLMQRHRCTCSQSDYSIVIVIKSLVKAFPRNLRSGLPLRRIGRSGDSRLTPNQNLLMSDG